MVVSFPCLTSLSLLNLSEATRQLLDRHAFDLRNLGLFEIVLKPGVSLNFTVEQD